MAKTKVPVSEIRKLINYRKKLDEQIAKIKNDHGVNDSYVRGLLNTGGAV